MRSPRVWWRDWWAARLHPQAVWLLTQRHVYILPTRAGWSFALLVLLLLVASINYQLNLGYALTFLLAGSAVASLHITHAGLRGLSLQVRPPAPVHLGQDMMLEVVVNNPGPPRWGLGFGLQSREVKVWVDLEAASHTVVVLSATAHRRGLHALPVLQLETRFPFGLFRAWTVWRPAGQAWVYPAAEVPSPRLPVEGLQPDGDGTRAQRGTDDVDGVRPWQRGDGLRQVAWKKVAHTGELVSREHNSRAATQLWLRWDSLTQADTEQRLSRLTAWVLQAESQGLRWGLQVPGVALNPNQGLAHQTQALQSLATCQLERDRS